jgi:hypothetical protein
MTIDKVYENLMDCVNKLEDGPRNRIKEYVQFERRDIENFEGVMAKVLLGCLDEIYAESAKTSGRGNTAKACKRILKASIRGDADLVWIGKDGYQYFTSGYHGVALENPIDFPMVDDSFHKCPGVEQVIHPDSLSKDYAFIDLPTINMIKQHKKLCKAEGRVVQEGKKKFYVWDFGENMPYVNADYLLDVMEALPNCQGWYDTKKPNFSPIFVTSDFGTGIIMPIRPKPSVVRQNDMDRFTNVKR